MEFRVRVSGGLVLGPFCYEMHTPLDAMVSIFHVLVLDTRFELGDCDSFVITVLKGRLCQPPCCQRFEKKEETNKTNKFTLSDKSEEHCPKRFVDL